jgi:leucine dehydrogenase
MLPPEELRTAPEQLVVACDRAARALFVVVVHDTRLGPAHGGIRRWTYPTLDAAVADAKALAAAMTWKCALAGLPAGGGKAVLLDHDELDRAAAYRALGRQVEQLAGRFCTGPDVGTTDDDLRQVALVTRFVAVGAGGAQGPGDLADATAQGVEAAMVALVQRLGGRAGLAGLRIAVQGLGAVGMALAARVHAAGGRLVVADPLAERTAAAAARFGADVVDSAAITAVPCDVFAPCALGGVITAEVAAALPAQGVCGAANNVLAAPAAGRELHRRGVLLVPDVVANAGALIVGAHWQRTGERVAAERVQRIGATAGEVLDGASAAGVPPTEFALALARERVERGPC